LDWRIRFTPSAEKDLKKTDKTEAERIIKFLRARVSSDPRNTGKNLKGQLRDFWRYRVGDYRILARIEDEQLIVLVVRIGHRKEVYKNLK